MSDFTANHFRTAALNTNTNAECALAVTLVVQRILIYVLGGCGRVYHIGNTMIDWKE